MDRVAMLKQMVEQRPDDPFPRYGLAMELRKGDQTDEAWAAFDSLMTDHPDYLPTYLMAGTFLHGLERTAEAREVLQRGIEVARKAGDGHTLSELEAALVDLA